MKIVPKYSNRIIAVPGAVLDRLSDAGRCELAVLIYVMSDHSATVSGCMSALGISRERLMSALDYWSEAGVLSYSGLKRKTPPASQKQEVTEEVKEADAPADPVTEAPDDSEFVQMTIVPSNVLADGGPGDAVDAEGETGRKDDGKGVKQNKTKKPAAARTVKALRSAAELPAYTAGDISRIVKEKAGVSEMLYSCQQSLGKIFNIKETETLVGLLDYLRLSPEYIMLLCAYLGRRGKTSLRYVEQTAIGFFDDGITDISALEEHILKLEAAADAEGQLRRMFGMGDRALTKKEKSSFALWCGEWKFAVDVIGRAYEIAVARTGKASVPYTGGILERWHSEGAHTAAEVDALIARSKQGSDGGTKQGANPKGSFDTDDFFDAALKRSYGG